MENHDEGNKRDEDRSAPGRAQRRRSQSLPETPRCQPRRHDRRSSSMMTPPDLHLSTTLVESPQPLRGRSKENRRSDSREEPKECEGQTAVCPGLSSHSETSRAEPDCSLILCLLHSPGPAPGPSPSCGLSQLKVSGSASHREELSTGARKVSIKSRRRALRF